MLLIISKKYVPSPTLFQQEQLNKIFELCGSPDEKLWPGVSKMPWFNNFKPARPLKRRVREFFRHFDRHALELLEKMLVLDPAQVSETFILIPSELSFLKTVFYCFLDETYLFKSGHC
jgi:hypothetical protein